VRPTRTTAEAIDFCAFYAHEMLRYAQDQPLTPIKGERGRLSYHPLGVGVVISPWNFPCAILTGMAGRRPGHGQYRRPQAVVAGAGDRL